MKSKALSIIVTDMNEAGIENAEVLLSKMFKTLKDKSLPKIAVDPETNAVEKSAAGMGVMVLGGLEPAFNKLIDFDGDGEVG